LNNKTRKRQENQYRYWQEHYSRYFQ